MAAILTILISGVLAEAAYLWHRAGRRRGMLSTRERRHRPRSSFLFSERGKRRKSARREPVRYLPRSNGPS